MTDKTEPKAKTNEELLAEMGIYVEKTSDIDPNFNMLLYAESGNGKTFLCSTLPEPVLIIDCEKGSLSIRDQDLDIVKVKSRVQLQAIIKTLRSGLLTSKKFKGKPFKTIVVDSGTELQQMIMDEITGVDGVEESLVTLQHWGQIGTSMSKLIRNLRDIDVNVAVTALDKKVEKRKDYFQLYPSVKGGFINDFPGYFDFVFYLGIAYKEVDKMIGDEPVKDGEGNAVKETISTRYLLTNSTDSHFAKDRSGKLSKFAKKHDGELNLKEIIKTAFALDDKPKKEAAKEESK